MHFCLKAIRILIIGCLVCASGAFGHESEPRPPFEHPNADNALNGHAHLGWDSSYFSEGRDSLDGDSLFASSVEWGWRQLVGGVWYGYSPDQHYEEFQINLAWSQNIGDVEFYGGYTHLRFPSEDSSDNELGTGFAWSGLPMKVELATDIYYSFNADGYFAEISAGREWLITEQLALHSSILMGINQGYVSDGHDGTNHCALQLSLEHALTRSASFTAHTTYSWAIDQDTAVSGDEQLINFFHLGAGLQWSF